MDLYKHFDCYDILGVTVSDYLLRFVLSHLDFQTAGLTNDIELLSLCDGDRYELTVMMPTEAFAGAGITDYTIGIGIGGDLTKYMNDEDVMAVPAKPFEFENPQIESWNAHTSIRASAISVGANLDQSTAGIVEFYLKIARIKQ